jgi:prephenate dehydrogenase
MTASPVIIDRLAIVGTGLIGGSFARALRAAGAVTTIVGTDADPRNLEQALALGVVDAVAPTIAEAVRGAQVVFISVPVCAIPGVVRELTPYLAPGCVVTDGGSVKAAIVVECERLMPSGCSFLGGHPIAGTEHSGAAAAFATLYQGKRCILTPTDNTDAGAYDTVSRLWQAAGASVCCMEPGHHDRIFAEISHLPHVVAYALVHAVGTADVEGENVLSYTAGGFRDFTRIASSDPAMWRDISLMNRDALLASIDGFSRSLAELRSRIEHQDPQGLAEFFTIAKKFRDGIV